MSIISSLRSVRFEKTALFDFILTIIGALILTKMTKIPLVITTVLLLVGGELIHYMFGIQTNTIKYLMKCEA